MPWPASTTPSAAGAAAARPSASRPSCAEWGVGWPWFTLGDLDLGTHIARTSWLREGVPLSEVGARGCTARWPLGVRLLPATDDEVETHVTVGDPDGRQAPRLHFQEWWTRYRATLPALALRAARRRGRRARPRRARGDRGGRRRRARAVESGRLDRHDPGDPRACAMRSGTPPAPRRRRLPDHRRRGRARHGRRLPHARSASRRIAAAVARHYGGAARRAACSTAGSSTRSTWTAIEALAADGIPTRAVPLWMRDDRARARPSRRVAAARLRACGPRRLELDSARSVASRFEGARVASPSLAQRRFELLAGVDVATQRDSSADRQLDQPERAVPRRRIRAERAAGTRRRARRDERGAGALVVGDEGARVLGGERECGGEILRRQRGQVAEQARRSARRSPRRPAGSRRRCPSASVSSTHLGAGRAGSPHPRSPRSRARRPHGDGRRDRVEGDRARQLAARRPAATCRWRPASPGRSTLQRMAPVCR